MWISFAVHLWQGQHALNLRVFLVKLFNYWAATFLFLPYWLLCVTIFFCYILHLCKKSVITYFCETYELKNATDVFCYEWECLFCFNTRDYVFLHLLCCKFFLGDDRMMLSAPLNVSNSSTNGPYGEIANCPNNQFYLPVSCIKSHVFSIRTFGSQLFRKYAKLKKL